MYSSIITTGIAKLQATMMQRARELDSTMLAATREATTAFRNDSIKAMNQGIYSKAVPTHAETQATGGRKRARKAAVDWVRTGTLRRSEKQRIISPSTGEVRNDARYAVARHIMPDGKLKFRGVDRTCHWRTDTINAWRAAGKPRSYYQRHLENMLLRTAYRA